MLHCWATDIDDPTDEPRWGKVGKQTIEDAGTLYPKRMETVDDEILDHALKFIDKAKSDGKPFFVWLNPTRMHVVTHLSEKYEKMRNAENGWIDLRGRAWRSSTTSSARVMKKLEDAGLDDNTIVVFTTDNGAENFTWPDGGQTPFAGGKGTVLEGGFRVPCIVRWPGKVPAGKVENGIMSGLDWFPTLRRRGRQPEHRRRAQAGQDSSAARPTRSTSTATTSSTSSPARARRSGNEIFYFAEATLGAVRIDDYKYRFIDQPSGWLGGTVKVDWPILVNLRLDPFERTGLAGSRSSYDRLVHVRVLAVRLRAAGGGQVRPDLHRLPADAEARVLQPGSGQGAGGARHPGAPQRLSLDRPPAAPLVAQRRSHEPSTPPSAPSANATSRSCQPMVSRTPLVNVAAVVRVVCCRVCCRCRSRQAARSGPVHSGTSDASSVPTPSTTPPTTPPATEAETRWPVCDRLTASGPEPSGPSWATSCRLASSTMVSVAAETAWATRR